MRFSVDQASLLAVLKRAATCTTTSTQRLDERLVRLARTKDAHGNDALGVGATDHVLAIRTLVEGPEAGVVFEEDEEEGDVAAPGGKLPSVLLFDAKDFVERIGRMPPGRISLRLKNARYASGAYMVAIQHAHERRAFNTAAVPPRGFAPIRWPDKSQAKNLADLSGETLARLLLRAMWAAEPVDQGRGTHTVYVSIARDRIRVSAGTDRSIAVVELPAGALVTSHVDGEPWEASLSLKVARALVSFGQGVGPGTLSLSAALTGEQLVVDYGSTRFGCALVGQPYRDLHAILTIVTKGPNTQEIVVPKKAFLESVAAMRAAINPTSDNPGLYLCAHGEHLHLVAEGAGDARDAIRTATPIARPMVGQYLPVELDEAAKACAGDDVSLTFCDAMGTPLLLTDVHGGIELSAVLIGMVKYRSKTVDAILAGKDEAS